MRHDGTRSPDGFERHSAPTNQSRLDEFIVTEEIQPGQAVRVGVDSERLWMRPALVYSLDCVVGIAISFLRTGTSMFWDANHKQWTPPLIVAKSEIGVTHYVANEPRPLGITAADILNLHDAVMANAPDRLTIEIVDDAADTPTIIGEDAKAFKPLTLDVKPLTLHSGFLAPEMRDAGFGFIESNDEDFDEGDEQ